MATPASKANTPPNGLSDADGEYRRLMARYQTGDREAFEQLYARLAPDLEAYLDALSPRSAGAAPIIDAVFVQIHHARRSYDPRKPFEPWVTAVARHVARVDDGPRRTLLGTLLHPLTARSR